MDMSHEVSLLLTFGALAFMPVSIITRLRWPGSEKSWWAQACQYVALALLIAYVVSFGHFALVFKAFSRWTIFDYMIAFVLPTAAAATVWALRPDLRHNGITKNRFLKVWLLIMACLVVLVTFISPVHH
jgi:hypothetical protein